MVRKLSLLMFTAFFIMTTSRTLESIADEKNDGRVVEMSVRPAAEPEYILRYSFRPEFQDERQGNAVTYYNTAAALYNQLKEEHKETSEKIRKWLELPIEKLPQKEIRDILETFQNTFAYIHKGSLRERCFWEFPIREERVYEILMPNLGTFRNIARALALQARLQIAEGHIEQAMQTLQTGFMLARHLGEAPILIHNLVGIAIAQIMLEATEHLIQSPDTSNLYWALTELHSPFISMKEAMRVNVR